MASKNDLLQGARVPELGLRSAVAGETLRRLGYERVENLVDGFVG